MTTTSHPQLQALVSEDCRDLLDYLANERVPGGEAVMRLSKDPRGLAALENIVLQIARSYAICAYEQPTDLEIFTPRLQASLDEYPELLAVVRTYQANVDLQSLNENLAGEDLDAQSERLSDYLGQFLPDRLG